MGQFNLGDCETPKPKATMFNIPDELEGRQVAVRVPVGWQAGGFKEDQSRPRDAEMTSDSVHQPQGFFTPGHGPPVWPTAITDGMEIDSVERRLVDSVGHKLDQQFLGLVGWVTECVKKAPGKTPRELAAIFSNGDHKKFNRRLPEAEKKGLVRRGEFRKCNVSGYATEWWPAEKA